MKYSLWSQAMKLAGEVSGAIVLVSVAVMLPFTTSLFTFGAGIVLVAMLAALLTMSLYIRSSVR